MQDLSVSALHSQSRSDHLAGRETLTALAVLLMAFDPAAAFHPAGPRRHCCQSTCKLMHASSSAVVADRRNRIFNTKMDSDDLPQDLNSLTVKQLKALLKARGMKVGGLKAELIARLDELRGSQLELLDTLVEGTVQVASNSHGPVSGRPATENVEDVKTQLKTLEEWEPQETIQEGVVQIRPERPEKSADDQAPEKNLPFGVTLVTKGWEGYEERVDPKTGKHFWVRVTPIPGDLSLS